MSVFPPPHKGSLALITGASTGIGRDVALDLARAGWVVAALARSGDKLEEVRAEAALLGGNIIPCVGDVTDRPAIQKQIRDLDAGTHGPIELALLNAGSYRAEGGDNLRAENIAFHLELNVGGVANALEPLIAGMKARGRGQIAVVASVAGYMGLPRASGYGASKAALINLCESLALDCAPQGIKVQLINPGFVKTPLTDKNDFPMPFLISSAEASQRILQGLAGNDFEITFPRRFAYMLKLLHALPYPAFFWLMRQGLKQVKS